MYRGLTLFRCTNCGHTFVSHDMEYKATSFSIPQRCTKCGSIRTLPGILAKKKDYEKIWEEIEEAGDMGYAMTLIEKGTLLGIPWCEKELERLKRTTK